MQKFNIFIITFFLFILNPIFIEAQSKYQITLLNIGEGDAILINNTEKQDSLLIDAGTPVTSTKILNFIKDNHINTLSKVVFTHPHLDHIGGVFGFLSFFEEMKEQGVETMFFDNGEDLSKISKDEDIYRHYEKIVRTENYQTLSTGDKLKFYDLEFTVLNPDQNQVTQDWNTNSLVMMLKYKDFKMLLMGDANFETEKYLVETMCDDLKANILKAGHHGGKDTASPEFLKCVKAENVLVSVGENAKFGSPCEGVINRYKGTPSEVYTTKEDGDITLSLEKVGKHVNYDIIFDQY